MRITIFFVLLIALAFSSCKTKQTTKQEIVSTVRQPEDITLDMFINNYIGLKKGDTINKVFEIFGEPYEHKINDEYDFNTVYYRASDTSLRDTRALAFSYFKDTKKIYTVELHRAAAHFLREKGVNDVVFIDMHGDELRKLFGAKEYGHVGNLRYDEKDYSVEFYCYDFHGHKCFNYDIYWWRRN